MVVFICPEFETPFYNISLSLHMRSRGGKRETQMKLSVIISHEEQKAMIFEVVFKQDKRTSSQTWKHTKAQWHIFGDIWEEQRKATLSYLANFMPACSRLPPLISKAATTSLCAYPISCSAWRRGRVSAHSLFNSKSKRGEGPDNNDVEIRSMSDRPAKNWLHVKYS